MDLERRITELERKLNNMVRECRVTRRNTDGTVCVDLGDDQVSGNLPVLHARTRTVRDWNIPEVGEQVLCVFLPVGLEEGFVIGSLYSEADATPTADNTLRVLAGERVKLGEFDADHPLAYGDNMQDLFNRLLLLLQSMAPIGNLGIPVPFFTDVTGTDGPTGGGITAVKTALQVPVTGPIAKAVSPTVETK